MASVTICRTSRSRPARGGADRQFAAARRATRQQVREVDARDQQHEADRGEHHHAGAGAADEIGLQRSQVPNPLSFG
jgi:hypothetical protein